MLPAIIRTIGCHGALFETRRGLQTCRLRMHAVRELSSMQGDLVALPVVSFDDKSAEIRAG
jgi:hypothetical protein